MDVRATNGAHFGQGRGKEPRHDQAMVAESPLMRAALERARRFAGSDATVLLLGESGTGKEVVARFMHQQSGRAQSPYVRINCAALPESLIEGELFGHSRGAFTGADQDRLGKLEWAEDGTVLLDEVGELPLGLQAKLLRVLEEGEFQRLGDNRVIPLRSRVIASTNRDLGTEVVEGRFRADLYYRLFVLNIELPRLRDRPEDLLPLARHFLNQYAPAPMQLGRRAICQVMAHDWPGNVRELKNVMQRAAVLADGERIEELEIVELPHRLAADGNWPAIPLAEAERRTLEAALRQAEGNQAAAARILEVAPKTVGNMLRRQRVAA